MAIITAPAELPKSAPNAPMQRQPDIAETEATTSPAPEKSEEDALSSKYAMYAKKERALRSRVQELKAREDAIKAKEAEYANSYIPKSSLSERLSKDPLGFLTENGVSHDQIALMALNQPSPHDTLIQELKKEVAELRGTQTQALTKIEEQQKQAYDRALNQIRNESKVLVDSNPDFETIKESNSGEAVVELIKETFEKDGILLSVEDAAKEVEAYLIEEALKWAQYKKVKAKLTPSEAALSEEPEVGAPKLQINEKQPLARSAPMKTLTHAVASSSKPMSPRERAIMAFKGQLK